MQDVYFHTIQEFNDFYGLETLHPLVSVVRFDKPRALEEATYHYGLYALFLKENKGCKLSYGRTEYDFDEMTVTSFAPGQVIHVEPNPDVPVPKWTAVVFHPDLLSRIPLGKHISRYEFFDYTSNEALHLSCGEIEIFRGVLSMIQQELQRSIDKHSRELIVSNIELLLNYCLRFYDRQFYHQRGNQPFGGEEVYGFARPVHCRQGSIRRISIGGLFCRQMLLLDEIFWRVGEDRDRPDG